jgi:hypothetical protein
VLYTYGALILQVGAELLLGELNKSEYSPLTDNIMVTLFFSSRTFCQGKSQADSNPFFAENSVTLPAKFSRVVVFEIFLFLKGTYLASTLLEFLDEFTSIVSTTSM